MEMISEKKPVGIILMTENDARVLPQVSTSILINRRFHHFYAKQVSTDHRGN